MKTPINVHGLLAGMLILQFASLQCFGASASDDSIRSLWPVRASHAFQQALKPELGFSFTYDGKKVGPSASPEWQVTRSADGKEVRARHSSGLTAIRRARFFPGSEALEYTVVFKNDSTAVLPAVSNVNAVDLTFGPEILKGVSVVTSGGGGAESVFPPKDFALARTYFGPMTPVGGQVRILTDMDKPSRLNLPFFFVENEEKAAGIYVGIGWTGQWMATIQGNFTNETLRIQGGMTNINIRLQPGEEISGPDILLGAFRGPLSAGSNTLRRLIRDHYAPSVGGARLVPPMLFTTWFDNGAELEEKLARSLADVAAAVGEEIYLVDAGWYKGSTYHKYTDMAGTWPAISNPLGNWEQGEEPSKFPSGLKALADYVRSKGMKFGLWFEPERSGPDSLLARQHRDWMTFIPRRAWGAVNLGKPEVQDYFCGILDRFIKEFGVAYIRWDHNNNLLPYWAQADPPDRRGISQIRHVEGLHKIEDFVRKNHPNVIFESCAGGGNRIDLQTLQRRHTVWVSDQTMDPHIVRFHLEGLNFFIPGNGQGVAFSPPTSTYQKPGFSFPDIAYQSFFAGALGLAGRLNEWPESMKQQARKHFEAYKKIRRFVSEDYYLLLPQSHTLDTWSGWQFHDPKANEGFVQAFRMRAPEKTKKLVLQGLSAKASYRFTDVYTGKSFDLPGARLTSEGLEFDLPQMSSSVLLYKRL